MQYNPLPQGPKISVTPFISDCKLTVKSFLSEDQVMRHGLEKLMQIDPTYVASSEDRHGSVNERLSSINAMNKRKPRGRGKNTTGKKAISVKKYVRFSSQESDGQEA